MKRLWFLLLVSSLIIVSCGDSGEDKAAATPAKKETKKKPKEEEIEIVTVPTKSSEASEDAAAAPSVPPEQLAKAQEILDNVSDDDIAAVDAKGKFKTYCAACHGFTGDLMVNGAKDLTASALPMKERVAQIYFGKGLMTPFKGLLKDPEIVAVSKYLETLRK